MMRFRRQSGYILPATIMLSLGIIIVSTVFLQYIANASTSLNAQIYKSYAEEAAQSGIAYVRSCVASSVSNFTVLRPDTRCDGSSDSSSLYIHQTSEWRSKFVVSDFSVVGGNLVATSTGTVEVLSNGVRVNRVDVVQKVTLPSTTSDLQVADGNVITDLSTEWHSCAIANGQLYCWGYNQMGQLGIGNKNDQSTPQLVTAFTGKIVTKVVVGTINTCAIADGELYCWGDNDFGQIGNGTHANADNWTTPVKVGGLLSGRKVTDVVITQGSINAQSACAIADGVVYCWGANNNQQLGQAKYNWLWTPSNIIGVSTNGIDTGDEDSPTPVWGYHTDTNGYDSGSPLYGKKVTSVAVGEGQAYATSSGKFYRWGEVTIYGASQVRRPEMVTTGAAVGRIADPYGISAVYGSSCGWSTGNLICFGIYSPLWGDEFFNPLNPYNSNRYQTVPTIYYTNTGVTSHDGGYGTVLYSPGWNNPVDCITANGILSCAGPAGYTGSNNSGTGVYYPITATPDMYGKIPTKVGVGITHSCFVANGSLFCWGDTSTGDMADGQLSSSSPTAKLVASATFGTSSNTGAATGPISVGGDHACAVVNAQLFCWGENGKGQLGIGNDSDQNQPVSVFTPGTVVTKVSAGKNHTCAIVNSKLYCWGDNSSGQLGIGNKNNQVAPTIVPDFLNTNKVVTDVSAGDTGTCAIADNQAYCWGANGNKQVGNNSVGSEALSPMQVTAGSGILTGKAVSAITIGKTHACAIADGNAYCWGDNTSGAAGVNPIGVNSGNIEPIQVTGGTAGVSTGNIPTAAFTAISAGSNFTCGIINGVVGCWGKNDSGQLGNGSSSNNWAPSLLDGAAADLQADSISAGDTHACANLEGKTYCWGSTATNRIGTPVTNNPPYTSTPQAVTIAHNNNKVTINVSAGFSSTCNVANGRIQCWGDGTSGKLGNGNTNSEPNPRTTNGYKILSPYSKGSIY